MSDNHKEGKQMFYHVTPLENVEAILKDGLVLLSVDVAGLNVRLTTPLIENTDEICIWGDIPPERIRVVR